MSLFGTGRASKDKPTGRVIATFDTYEAAQKAVGKVSEQDITIQGIVIVGRDLQLVERITGKLSWGQVALSGLVRGLFFGVFIGLFYSILFPENFQSLLLFPLLGAAFGIALGLASHAMSKNHRPYASTQQVMAERFDLLAPTEIAGRAQNIVGQVPATAASAGPGPGSGSATPLQPGSPGATNTEPTVGPLTGPTVGPAAEPTAGRSDGPAAGPTGDGGPDSPTDP